MSKAPAPGIRKGNDNISWHFTESSSSDNLSAKFLKVHATLFCHWLFMNPQLKRPIASFWNRQYHSGLTDSWEARFHYINCVRASSSYVEWPTYQLVGLIRVAGVVLFISKSSSILIHRWVQPRSQQTMHRSSQFSGILWDFECLMFWLWHTLKKTLERRIWNGILNNSSHLIGIWCPFVFGRGMGLPRFDRFVFGPRSPKTEKKVTGALCAAKFHGIKDKFFFILPFPSEQSFRSS